MNRFILLIALIVSFLSALSQNQYPVTYQQLKEFEGLYEYSNHTTLRMAASTKDTTLYAIINESRYALKSFAKNIFQNSTKDKVTFFRNKAGKVNAYSIGNDTFRLITNKITFPKEMWYPRIGNTNYSYRIPPALKDGLPTGNLNNT